MTKLTFALAGERSHPHTKAQLRRLRSLGFQPEELGSRFTSAASRFDVVIMRSEGCTKDTRKVLRNWARAKGRRLIQAGGVAEMERKLSAGGLLPDTEGAAAPEVSAATAAAPNTQHGSTKPADPQGPFVDDIDPADYADVKAWLAALVAAEPWLTTRHVLQLSGHWGVDDYRPQVLSKIVIRWRDAHKLGNRPSGGIFPPLPTCWTPEHGLDPAGWPKPHMRKILPGRELREEITLWEMEVEDLKEKLRAAQDGGTSAPSDFSDPRSERSGLICQVENLKQEAKHHSSIVKDLEDTLRARSESCRSLKAKLEAAQISQTKDRTAEVQSLRQELKTVRADLMLAWSVKTDLAGKLRIAEKASAGVASTLARVERERKKLAAELEAAEVRSEAVVAPPPTPSLPKPNASVEAKLALIEKGFKMARRLQEKGSGSLAWDIIKEVVLI